MLMQAQGFQVICKNLYKEIPGPSKSENPRPVTCLYLVLAVICIGSDMWQLGDL